MKYPMIRQMRVPTEMLRRINSFESDIQAQTNTSSFERPNVKVIVTLETNGEFLTKAMRACQATGLSLDQLFEVLSENFMARLNDTFPLAPMMDSKMPSQAQLEVQDSISSILDELERQAQFINRNNTESLKILEIDNDDEWALIELKPRHESDTPTDAGVAVRLPSRRKNRPTTADTGN